MTVEGGLTLFGRHLRTAYESIVMPVACQNGAETTDIER
jgi:hypothetical protein